MNTTDPTLILLALWDQGGLNGPVRKKLVTDRVKKNRKVSEFVPVFEDLQEKGAVEKVGRYEIRMLPLGVDLLRQGLKNEALQSDEKTTVVGARYTNALLKWIREMGGSAAAPVANGKPPAIGSYEDFKPIALETYDRLNRDYNYDDLVPIYRIRREIGDRVSRSEFSDWMLKMQANDIFQFLESSIEDGAEDKIRDSITDGMNRRRCYAKKLN